MWRCKQRQRVQCYDWDGASKKEIEERTGNRTLFPPYTDGLMGPSHRIMVDYIKHTNPLAVQTAQKDRTRFFFLFSKEQTLGQSRRRTSESVCVFCLLPVSAWSWHASGWWTGPLHTSVWPRLCCPSVQLSAPSCTAHYGMWGKG